MNTPAHVVLNAWVLGRGPWRRFWLPITAGALLPDLPMVGFYAFERLVRGTSERQIWSHAYFDPHWQAFFDVFNSLPLLALAAVLAWRAGRSRWLAMFVSMALHALADLPLHNEDAHAHFFPLTSWRFRSPVSYWDPQHYGLWFAAAELALVVGGALALARRRSSAAWPALGMVSAVFYLLFGAYALGLWGFPAAAG